MRGHPWVNSMRISLGLLGQGLLSQGVVIITIILMGPGVDAIGPGVSAICLGVGAIIGPGVGIIEVAES